MGAGVRYSLVSRRALIAVSLCRCIAAFQRRARGQPTSVCVRALLRGKGRSAKAASDSDGRRRFTWAEGVDSGERRWCSFDGGWSRPTRARLARREDGSPLCCMVQRAPSRALFSSTPADGKRHSDPAMKGVQATPSAHWRRVSSATAPTNQGKGDTVTHPSWKSLYRCIAESWGSVLARRNSLGRFAPKRPGGFNRVESHSDTVIQ